MKHFSICAGLSAHGPTFSGSSLKLPPIRACLAEVCASMCLQHSTALYRISCKAIESRWKDHFCYLEVAPKASKVATRTLSSVPFGCPNGPKSIKPTTPSLNTITQTQSSGNSSRDENPSLFLAQSQCPNFTFECSIACWSSSMKM
jgi:hypothetical protein